MMLRTRTHAVRLCGDVLQSRDNWVNSVVPDGEDIAFDFADGVLSALRTALHLRQLLPQTIARSP